MLPLKGCDCKQNPFAVAVARGVWSVKTKLYMKVLALESISHGILQLRLKS